ncbi:FMN-binding protein [Streptacidiphilus fuscans]|uniref:FMN-binding protein n=1 Tax=Streptacidiphilus fuscans TaxID=2789292 RepID=A0A931FF33_9ACTN|nr:FMN-binding protein [Streptacidiphilus fuscans]MBF9071208.1 FMN-binding protein [Streptacidiphilus fuscans]
MRRAIVTTTATAAGVVLLLSLKPHGAASAAGAPVISSGSGTAASTGGQPNGSASTPATGSSSGSTGSTGSTGSGSSTGSSGSTKGTSGSSSSSGAKSGTFTGQAADTRYGPVQVQLVVSGGKISNVNVLQYPNESQRDMDINSYALPTLNQEVLSQQSAQIDMVSGATYTSNGYAQSLQSALDAAGIK